MISACVWKWDTVGGRRDYSGLMGENKVAFDVKQTKVPEVVECCCSVAKRKRKRKTNRKWNLVGHKATCATPKSDISTSDVTAALHKILRFNEKPVEIPKNQLRTESGTEKCPILALIQAKVTSFPHFFKQWVIFEPQQKHLF